MTEETVVEIFSRFHAAKPNPSSELISPNPFCFLVSVVLSAQATDASVNKATKKLYETCDTPEKMRALGTEGLEGHIKSIGLYHSKARHVIALAEKLVTGFEGQVPRTRKELESLPGVGRKTASVVLGAVFGEVTMPVDTHLLRVSPRIGLSSGGTPKKVEGDLLERIPAEFLPHAHHWLLLHGRYVCKARNPRCDECLIEDLCEQNGVKQWPAQ